MEIHSSSLTSIPVDYKGKNRLNQPQARTNKESSIDNQRTSASQTVNALDKKNSISKLKLISDNIEQQQKTPTNSRTARAVNAYIQENSQTIKNQRSELISGIDLFA